MKAVDQALDAGADVNSKGNGNMTPLLWCYKRVSESKTKKIDVFSRLLERGANPNIPATTGLVRHDGEFIDKAVIHLVSMFGEAEFVDVCLKHGADPNLRTRHGDTPILFRLQVGWPFEIKVPVYNLLINSGALVDGDLTMKDERSPTTTAIFYNDFKSALFFLRKGADPTLPVGKYNLAHSVADKVAPPGNEEDLQAVIDWLEAHGLSIAQAKEDKKRWKEWQALPQLEMNFKHMQEEEQLAERDVKAREIWQKALAEDRAREAAQAPKE